MEILELQSGRYKTPEEITEFQKSVDYLMGEPNYGYLLGRRWHAIVEIDHPGSGPDIDHFLLDVEAEAGGGSFAQVKMNTLKRYPNAPATGLLSLKDISELITAAIANNCIAREDMVTAAGLLSLTEGALLSRVQHEWLRDRLDVTTFMGGVRLGIYEQESVIDSDDETFRKKGEIRVSVSGATEWQDAYLALTIAKLAITSFHYEIVPDSLAKLLLVPNLHFLCNLIPEQPIIVVP